MIVILMTIAGVAFGLYGMHTTTLGLELADVLPENTAPAAFMRYPQVFILIFEVNFNSNGSKYKATVQTDSASETLEREEA